MDRMKKWLDTDENKKVGKMTACNFVETKDLKRNICDFASNIFNFRGIFILKSTTPNNILCR